MTEFARALDGYLRHVAIERGLAAAGKTFETTNLHEMEELYQAYKKQTQTRIS